MKYIKPNTKFTKLTVEHLMQLSVHDEVGDDTQLSKGAGFDDDDSQLQLSIKSVWED